MNRKLLIFGLVLVTVGLLGFLTLKRNAVALVPAIHTRLSVNNSGNGQGGNSFTPGGIGGNYRISADGRYAVFPSYASNLVANDTNAKSDTFVRDIDANVTTRVSVSVSNVQSNGDSGVGNTNGVAISQTGRYIAFSSNASNLIDGTTISGGTTQVYIKDTKNNTLSLVTQKSDGTLGNADASVEGVSNDGRFVLWRGGKNTNLVSQGGGSTSSHLYLADMKDRSFKLLAPTDGSTLNESSNLIEDMSCDGSFVVTPAMNQLTTDDTDTASDIYLLDLRNGLTIKNLTSASNINASKPSISCNGNFITFESKDPVFDAAVPSTNTLSHLFLYDRINESYSIVDITAGGTVSGGNSYGLAGIDDQGNVVFSGNNSPVSLGSSRTQMILKNRSSGLLELVTRNAFSNSSASQATLTRASLSSDGKRVIYAVGDPANSLFIPASGGPYDNVMYDSNGYGDMVMSLTGL